MQWLNETESHPSLIYKQYNVNISGHLTRNIKFYNQVVRSGTQGKDKGSGTGHNIHHHCKQAMEAIL